MESPHAVFETVVTPVDRRVQSLSFLGTVSVLGCIATGWSLGGMGLFIASCAALLVAAAFYGYLLRIAPPVTYVPYCWIDERGFHYQVEAQTRHYAWSEIAGVAEHTDPCMDEVPGISLFLHRPGRHGVPILLHMDREHAKEAARVLVGKGVPKH